MKKISVRELRYDFPKVERALRAGTELEVTKRNRVIARLTPVNGDVDRPDFMARLKRMWGGKKLAVSGAELISRERDER